MSRKSKRHTCPICESNLDYITATDGSDATPVEGDITLCGVCGGILEFGPEFSVKLLSTEAMDVLDHSTKVHILDLQTKIREFRSKESN